MYLLIGHPADRCCQLVGESLRAAGYDALTTGAPLAGDVIFSWTLTTGDSRSTLRWRDRADMSHESLRGVFVRMPGGPADVAGWSLRDRAYVQAETNAALVAWLRSLPCRVINRPDADLWFRPQRSPGESRALFERCRLPALQSLITNDLAVARRFAVRWNGRADYAPLTSTTRYPLADDSHWAELAKVMARVPVCLIEPSVGPPLWATVIGREVIWSARPELAPDAHARFDDGLRALAATLDVEWLQVELRPGMDGPRCATLLVYPQIEMYTPAVQTTIAAGIARLLLA